MSIQHNATRNSYQFSCSIDPITGLSPYFSCSPGTKTKSASTCVPLSSLQHQIVVTIETIVQESVIQQQIFVSLCPHMAHARIEPGETLIAWQLGQAHCASQIHTQWAKVRGNMRQHEATYVHVELRSFYGCLWLFTKIRPTSYLPAYLGVCNRNAK